MILQLPEHWRSLDQVQEALEDAQVGADCKEGEGEKGKEGTRDAEAAQTPKELGPGSGGHGRRAGGC